MGNGAESWWRITGGRYIRDIVFGANDGIITTFAVVAGVAGSHLPAVVVLLLGFANLVGDGISMGASNYLGTRSEDEMTSPHADRHLSKRAAMFRALATFIAFLVAGVVPLLSYVIPVPPESSFTLATVFTGFTLFFVGAARSFVIPRPWWKAGAEMFLVGAAAAGAAYAVGWLISSLVGYSPA